MIGPKKCYAVIDAPTDLGLKPTGVAGLPAALRTAGILQGLPDVLYAGEIPVPEYVWQRDSTTGVLNAAGIRSFSEELASSVTSVLDRGHFPFVLGGDCSILLGVGLALKRRGRFGLLFIDGHSDFYSPASEPNGEVASMDLAAVTGRVPDLLNDPACAPPFLDEDIVVFGFRDGEEAAEHGSPDVRATSMNVLDLDAVRSMGAARAASHSLEILDASGADGFWVHLDADVLSDDIMPAVDYRMPDGFSSDELSVVLRTVLQSPSVVGFDVTIYNPDLDDDDRSAARILAQAVSSGFAGRSESKP